jgi:hypothetical protein
MVTMVCSALGSPRRYLAGGAICLSLSVALALASDAAEPAPGTYDHLSISCGSALATVTGRVVFRDDDGALRPIKDIRFTITSHGTVHASHEKVQDRVRVDKQGRFLLALVLWSDTLEYFQGDKRVASRDVDDKGSVLLHAWGCQDRVLEFSRDLQAGDIEMVCHDRHSHGAV